MTLDPAAILPQRPPFRFVDEVVTVTAEGAHCRFRFPTEGACFSLRMDPALVLVEALAQTSAIHSAARDDGERGGELEGVMGGIDGFRVHARPRPGDVVELRARLRKQLGPVLLFDGTAHRGDEPLCEVRLTVRLGGTG